MAAQSKMAQREIPQKVQKIGCWRMFILKLLCIDIEAMEPTFEDEDGVQYTLAQDWV